VHNSSAIVATATVCSSRPPRYAWWAPVRGPGRGAGIEHGARRLYLQVESANAPAHAFYQRVGFARSHGYHYRAAPRRGAAG